MSKCKGYLPFSYPACQPRFVEQGLGLGTIITNGQVAATLCREAVISLGKRFWRASSSDVKTPRRSTESSGLHREGLVAFETNPHHRRAQLVMLTDKGRQAFDPAMRLQAPWINSISAGLSGKDIDTVQRMITALRKKLESNDETHARA